ncbi:hypothetical protein DICPUDRAFT_51993 [Dictyostelium purpureum]|uniref:IlvB-like protein n=1 Tax=Dictyostelium purpureum TaxID=5786 RepID=F0Z6C0_DICPU|nr:uncharacterized protein DICPUDRAFT_51993 [Dictyostelium purpureum]EGC40414.1 hypothetical protein DICPUDRAFT_51993 [Dictyostelium purpureum]|eukprot:XP_003282961.1 hypothetical protein DICPUDRAFT_51993 [Dictyostelium purpureum]
MSQVISTVSKPYDIDFKTLISVFGIGFLGHYLVKAYSRKIVRNPTVFRFGINSNGGELVANVLLKQGVSFIFTLTGGHIAPILIESDKIGIKVIDVRHEATTVFAADGVFRLTGTPGVAVVTAGPGLTNTITAVKNAQLAQSGVVLIGGATSDLLKGRGSLQDIDQFALLKPHVKWYAHVGKVADIVPVLERAFLEAKSGTPGPVFIEMPIDTLYPQPVATQWYMKNQDKAKSLSAKAINFYMNYHLNRIFSTVDSNVMINEKEPIVHRIEKSMTKRLRLALKASKRPVLVVGSQATLINDKFSVEALQRSVQALGIPVFTSSMSRGLLGTSHQNLFKHCRSYALQNADLVILAGVTCDFRLNYGKSINRNATIFSINRNKTDLYKNRTPEYPYLCDPSTFLVQLRQQMEENKFESPNAWRTWLDDLSSRDINRNLEIASKANLPPSKEGFLNPLKALQMFDEKLPHKTIMVADGGDFVGSAAYIVRPRGPLSWLDPGVFGTLGCGAGFALAAKLCRPDHQVWVIFGDGSFGYSLPEIDTFVRHKLAIGSIIGNDACWMQIMREQVDSLHSEVGCNLSYTNYQDASIALGGKGYKASNIDELKHALDESSKILDQNQEPVVVNCIIDRNDFRKGSISV